MCFLPMCVACVLSQRSNSLCKRTTGIVIQQAVLQGRQNSWAKSPYRFCAAIAQCLQRRSSCIPISIPLCSACAYRSPAFLVGSVTNACLPLCAAHNAHHRMCHWQAMMHECSWRKSAAHLTSHASCRANLSLPWLKGLSVEGERPKTFFQLDLHCSMPLLQVSA